MLDTLDSGFLAPEQRLFKERGHAYMYVGPTFGKYWEYLMEHIGLCVYDSARTRMNFRFFLLLSPW